MKVLHLSTSDSAGGAARAAYRVHSGLRLLGVDSNMLVLKKSSGDPSVSAFKSETGFMARMRRRNRHKKMTRDIAFYTFNRAAGYELFSDDRTEHASALVRQLPPCDILNLHWVAGFVDHESFFPGLPGNLPIIWRLADMGALTGGCHYDGGCGKFAQACGACPQLSSSDPNDLSHQIWNRKRIALQRVNGRLSIVATSRWIAAEAQKSSLLREFPITTIPNGLNTDDFAPRDRTFARQSLGIPGDARVVLFVAESTEIPRKGYALLVDAIRAIDNVPNLMLMSIGSGQAQINSPIRQLHIGKTSNDRLMSIVYSAADVFVIPSIQESFGQTVIESLACGTPVVGFDTGGIPDMVRPGLTGELAPVKDVPALRQAIARLLNDPARRADYSKNARDIAVNEYSLEVMARRYLDLYENTLTRMKRAA